MYDSLTNEQRFLSTDSGWLALFLMVGSATLVNMEEKSRLALLHQQFNPDEINETRDLHRQTLRRVIPTGQHFGPIVILRFSIAHTRGHLHLVNIPTHLP